MWIANPARLVKVCLHSDGHEVETPFAEDLGAAFGPPGSRLVRLANIPVLHAKPTYGDAVVVEPDADGRLSWNRTGVGMDAGGGRLAEDAGRWVMIVDYTLVDPTGDAVSAFRALDRACERLDVVLEGYAGPRDDHPGRAYLAVPKDVTDEAVLAALREEELPVVLERVEPTDGIQLLQ